MAIRALRTISVPADLDKAMGKLRNVNWSRIAQRAFKEHVQNRNEEQPETDISVSVALDDIVDCLAIIHDRLETIRNKQ